MDQKAFRKLVSTTRVPSQDENLKRRHDKVEGVKGLDFSLLAQNKAKLANAPSGTDALDDELESAFEQSKHTTVEPHTQRQLDQSQNGIVGPRGIHQHGRIPSQGESGGLGKGFKPIGSTSSSRPTVEQKPDEAEYKWVNGKRMRKKKKATTQQPPLPTPIVSTVPSSIHMAVERKSDDPAVARGVVSHPQLNSKIESPIQGTGTIPLVEAQEPSPRPLPAIHGDDDDDDQDEDIFADVGRWTGLAEIEDAPAQNSSPSDQIGAEDGELMGASTAPSDQPIPAVPSPVPALAQPIEIQASEDMQITPDTSSAQLIPTDIQPSAKPEQVQDANIPKLPPKKSKWEDDDDATPLKKKKKKSSRS